MKVIDEKVSVDEIDKIILNHLMEDAKKPILDIGRSIGISGAAIHQRLRKLEKAGLIEGAKLMINPKVLGYTTFAFVGIYLEKAVNNLQAVKRLQEIPEVLECHYTTGNWSIFLKILCRDNEHLLDLLNEHIQVIEGVARTETFISLNQQIQRQLKV